MSTSLIWFILLADERGVSRHRGDGARAYSPEITGQALEGWTIFWESNG